MITPTSTDIPAIAGGSPVREGYLVFGSPRIEETEIAEVVAVLRSGWIGTGPRTARFEREFAAYTGGRHAVSVSSCTAALHLSLLAAGIGSRDEVIVPAMTFVASANAVVHAGGTPVLCDVDPATQNIQADEVERRVTSRTKAIIPVHFAGRAVDLSALRTVADRYRLTIVNDAAHAIETEHQGRKVTDYGALTAYSFYPTKNITTGEGGMIVTDDDGLADRLRVLRLHGLSADAWRRFSDAGFKHYESIEPGFKYNMTDMQAALGLHQLARIEELSAKRERIWSEYDSAFESLPLQRPAAVEAGDRHARHLYTVMLDLDRLTAGRDVIAHALHLERIGIGVHYRGVHLHPYYRDRFGYVPSDFPHASWISERTLSLPMSAALTDDDIADVISAVTRVLTHFSK
jgi:dTDP-4-amino-4,6-dideoxygalactose transaminase